MKRSHRRAHLVLWLLVGPAALFVLWRALAARPPVPVQARRPPQVQGREQAPAASGSTETSPPTAGHADADDDR